MPRVFVGIPTLNRPQFVREAIGSVLGQTFHDFRLVVSDNVSTDEAIDSVSRFVQDLADPRVSFHRQPGNEGEYGQGRFFFRQVSGEDYFLILHDDDVLKPSFLERAVQQLESHPSLAYFVANPWFMNAKGELSTSQTESYRSKSGRNRFCEGEIDVLATLFHYGFTPVSGTLFRTSTLRDSGFVDEDCSGNFPFEFNLLLRLGERGAKAWFCPQELLGFRFHAGCLSNYLNLLENPDAVRTLILILERRQFAGSCERRRRAFLGRLYRARATIRLRSGDWAGGRRDIARALRSNWRSARSCATAPLIFLAPRLLRAALPPLPEIRFGQQPGDEWSRDYMPAARLK